ncbi:MAG: hypothetical protein ACI4L8_11420 [Candidatus Fimadaptatus sp.]
MSDREILRPLAARVREIATPEHHAGVSELYRSLNALKPQRPVVLINELPWNQLEAADEFLSLRCEGEFEREVERRLRRLLYQWDHFRCDMLVEPWYGISRTVHVGSIGVEIEEDTLQFDAGNNIRSHAYHDMIPDEAALERLHNPTIEVDEAADARNVERLEALIGDILPIRLAGGMYVSHFSPWDDISMLRGAEPMLWDLADRPEFMHALVRKLTDIALYKLDMAEKLNLIDPYQPIIHCTPGIAPELPGEIKDGRATRANIWGRGTAQIFSTVGPAMHEEFDIEYAREYFSGFGLVYYGCCEPLDRKIDIVRKLPNLRKISITPWADVKRAAEQMGPDFVMARKPNPAMVAVPELDEDALRADIAETLDVCRANGVPVEFVLKDISSCGYNPRNLDRWAAVVMDMVTR